MSSGLIPPHGGRLVDLLATPARALEIRQQSRTWPSLDLPPRQLWDLELLLSGGYSPLTSFLSKEDLESVCARMRLANGTLWPVPIALDLPPSLASTLSQGASLALRDPEGVLLAALQITDLWESGCNPLTGEVDPKAKTWFVTGLLEGIRLPHHYDYREWRRTPAQLREEFERAGWRRVAAWEPLLPPTRTALLDSRRICERLGARLLIHPTIGTVPADDADPHLAIRCGRALLAGLPPDAGRLVLTPLARRSDSVRDALGQALVRKNFGCSHLLVENPGRLEQLAPFREELGTEGVALDSPRDPADLTPEVESALRGSLPSRNPRGVTIFFTGLSGAGKSTIANILLAKVLEQGHRRVTFLDGDLVRKNLSSELGFSKEHRDLNIRRIGFVASEITKHGGIAICAPIAPYDAVRKEIRRMIERVGRFVLVHISAPLEVCESRDRKGLYAKARAGIVKLFTGVSDPYEEPSDAELVLDTTRLPAEASALTILDYLQKQGDLE